jgi:hypothetical protein
MGRVSFKTVVDSIELAHQPDSTAHSKQEQHSRNNAQDPNDAHGGFP